MTRTFLFLISYGLIVITISNMIFYFNYRALGYEWNEIFRYIFQTADFALFVIAACILILTVYVRVPSRLPFSRQ
jgi:phosphoglycerol transferase MdoB-like AlkP superfamily enzyme